MDLLTCVLVLQWLRSAATPATLAISYKASSSMRGCILSRSPRGWPIPPAAPKRATFTAWHVTDAGRSARLARVDDPHNLEL